LTTAIYCNRLQLLVVRGLIARPASPYDGHNWPHPLPAAVGAAIGVRSGLRHPSLGAVSISHRIGVVLVSDHGSEARGVMNTYAGRKLFTSRESAVSEANSSRSAPGLRTVNGARKEGASAKSRRVPFVP
jgi:hypothetical protein